jgi:hypothetical protein
MNSSLNTHDIQNLLVVKFSLHPYSEKRRNKQTPSPLELSRR